MITFIIIGFVSFIVLWLFFINVMWMKHNRDKIPDWLYYPAVVFAAIGFLYDVLFNIVYGSIMFWQKPDFKTAKGDLFGIPLPTLSERLRDILRCATAIEPHEFRYKMALFICMKMINPFDKNHCGLIS